ncbi:hypothetical protein [Blastococcus sp. SYSU DS0619]
MPDTDDETRWSEARSLLDDVPTESADRRARRSLRTRILIGLGVGLFVGAPLGIGVAWLADRSGDGATSAGAPLWQEITGLAVAGAGLLVLFGGVVAQFRANRRMRAWRSPLAVLTKAQRKELLAVVRGRGDLRPDRLPLARHLASNLLDQRALVYLLGGQAVLWVGLLIAFPSWLRAAAAVVLVALTVVGVPFMRRQERQARRFLAEHPEPDPLQG